MNYYENVVVDYLRADRALFVNTECCIQLNPAANPDTSGPHWYCDAVAVNFREKAAYLCEISYSAKLESLLNRLKGWHDNWDGVLAALRRDCLLPGEWPVRPWAFVPQELVEVLNRGLLRIVNSGTPRFSVKITPLQLVQPWRYSSWNRVGEETAKTLSE